MYAIMGVPRLTSTSCPQWPGGGRGGQSCPSLHTSLAMHSHPSSCGSTGLGRILFLVQREFGLIRRERSMETWAGVGEKQDLGSQTAYWQAQNPLCLSPSKVCVCLSVVKLKTHPKPPSKYLHWAYVSLNSPGSLMMLFATISRYLISKTVACP